MDTVSIIYLVVCGIALLVAASQIPRIVRLEQERGLGPFGIPIPRQREKPNPYKDDNS
jgi:hypothetical protein